MAEFIKYYKLDFTISSLYQEIITYDLFLHVIHLHLDVFPDRILNDSYTGKNVWASLNLYNNALWVDYDITKDITNDTREFSVVGQVWTWVNFTV